MGAFWLHPDYPMDRFEADANALPEGELHIVEAWPGSVTTEQYVSPDGDMLHFLDGVAIRVIGPIPAKVIAADFWLVPPEAVAELRQQRRRIIGRTPAGRDTAALDPVSPSK